MLRCDRCRGSSLFEVLVAMAILGLVLVAVGELSVLCQRAHAHTTGRVQAFRAAALAATRMSGELRLCQGLYSPEEPAAGWPYGQPLQAGPAGGWCLVFRRAVPGPAADQVVGFRFESGKGVLERLLYRPDFDPDRPETQKLHELPRTLAPSLEGVNLWLVQPGQRYGAHFVGLELVPSGAPGTAGEAPLRVETRVRDL